MKSKILFVSLLSVVQVAKAAPLSCEFLFAKPLAITDTEIQSVTAELEHILKEQSGPDADREVQRVLSGDVQKTLQTITNMIRADDRLMDDLLQGRRNTKSSQALSQLSESLSQYHALKMGEAKLGFGLQRLFPKRLKAREDELQQKIPHQSSLLQSVKAELERDVELLNSVRASTQEHILEIQKRLELLKILESRLEQLIPGRSILDEAMISRMRYEIMSQTQDLNDMGKTAVSSIAILDDVVLHAKLIVEKAKNQLNVILPRVAVETKTPSLMSSVQSGAQAAALVRVSPDHGALQAYGSSDDFQRLTSVLLNAKDIGMVNVAFDEIVKRQKTELPTILLKAFQGANGTALMLRFLEKTRDTQWTVSMTEVHTQLLSHFLYTRDQEQLTSLLNYGLAHPFDSNQTQFIFDFFLERRNDERERTTAAFLLLQHPQAHMIERLSSALRDESSSQFVAAISARIGEAKNQVHSGELADALQSHHDRAEMAKRDAVAEEKLQRLQSGRTQFTQDIGRRNPKLASDFTSQILRDNDHPERAQIAFQMVQLLAREKRSSVYNNKTVVILSNVGSALDFTIRNLRLKTRMPDLAVMAKALQNYEDPSRLWGLKSMLELVIREPAPGLRDLLDERIASQAAGDFQTLLLSTRLRLDLIDGRDALSDIYESRLKDIFSVYASEKIGSFTFKNSKSGLFIARTARDLFESNVVRDDGLQLNLLICLSPADSAYWAKDGVNDPIEATLRNRSLGLVESYLSSRLEKAGELSFVTEMGIRLGLQAAHEKVLIYKRTNLYLTNRTGKDALRADSLDELWSKRQEGVLQPPTKLRWDS